MQICTRLRWPSDTLFSLQRKLMSNSCIKRSRRAASTPSTPMIIFSADMSACMIKFRSEPVQRMPSYTRSLCWSANKPSCLHWDVAASVGDVAPPLRPQVAQIAGGCQDKVVKGWAAQNAHSVLAHHVLPGQQLQQGAFAGPICAKEETPAAPEVCMRSALHESDVQAVTLRQSASKRECQCERTAAAETTDL